MNLQEFINKYSNKYVDKYGNTNYSSVGGAPNYGGQCASLARLYLNVVGDYKQDTFGHGKDYINIPNAIRVSSPQNGDLVVYGATLSNPYGHVGIYYNGKVFSQNPNKASLSSLDAFKGTRVYIRPKLKSGALDVPKTTNKPSLGLYVTTANVNVRTGAGTNNRIKLVKELTIDGKKNATSSNSNANAVLKKGTRVSVLEVKQDKNGMYWGRIPSGYVSLSYAKKL